MKRMIKKIYNTSSSVERFIARFNLGFSLRRAINKKPKVGIAVLIWERAEYLEPCLDSLFKTNLYDYDVTFLLNDDGSQDPRVKELISKSRDKQYKIVRNFTPKGHGSWGAAFNKAIKKLLELDHFDLVGTCDSDVYFHPDWLKFSIETFLWAKKNHKDHKLIKFSAFNSSDYLFHKILGRYSSPYGNYLIKERMGDVTNLFFVEDLRKIGFYEESKDDETLKTEFFKSHKLRYFSTETSYVEHIGQVSLLNKWRPTPVLNAVHAMKPVEDEKWLQEIKSFRVHKDDYYLEFDREYNNYLYKISFWRSLGLIAKIRISLSRAWARIQERINNYLHYKNVQVWWNRNLKAFNQYSGVKVELGLPRSVSASDLKVDVILAAIERDLPVLEYTLESIRENLKHPINKFKIISPNSDPIKRFCEDHGCEFVDEDTVLPIKISDIDYKVGGKDRSGWLFQQLLKLSGDKISDMSHYIVFDSDTILLRPQVFEKEGKIVFELADEYHLPYFKAYERLMGLYSKIPFSLVSHHTLFDQEVLGKMKETIEERHGKSWIDAILDSVDKTESSGFSEFETYGNFFFEVNREKMIFEYWYNYSAKRADLASISKLRKSLHKKYKTLSFQYYSV